MLNLLFKFWRSKKNEAAEDISHFSELPQEVLGLILSRLERVSMFWAYGDRTMLPDCTTGCAWILRYDHECGSITAYENNVTGSLTISSYLATKFMKDVTLNLESRVQGLVLREGFCSSWDLAPGCGILRAASRVKLTMGTLSSLLLACPTLSPPRIGRSRNISPQYQQGCSRVEPVSSKALHGARRGISCKQLRQHVKLEAEGCRLVKFLLGGDDRVSRRSCSYSPCASASFPTTMDNSQEEVDCLSRNVARVLGLALLFAAFGAVGTHRALCGVALAAPAVETRSTEVPQPEIQANEELEMQKQLIQVFGLDKRFKSFEMSWPEREKEYREALGVDKMLNEIQAFKMQAEDNTESRLLEIIAQAKTRLTLDARRLQGKVLAETNQYVARVRLQERSSVRQLQKVVDGDPTVREKLEALAQKPDGEMSKDDQLKEFFSRTGDLRAEIRSLRADMFGSEFEGWLRAWHEIPDIKKRFEAELERAAKVPKKPSDVVRTAESRITDDLSRTGEIIWEQNVLPVAVNVEEPKAEIEMDKKLQSRIDGMVRNHISFAGEEKRKVLPSLKKPMGSVELYSVFGQPSSDIPDPESLRTILGWRKWCEIKKEELKEYLLQNPEVGRQYIQEKQEKLLIARDRVLERTWYNGNSKRWEMSAVAAVYAVDNNLVHHVRIRHDGRLMYLSLKGDNQDYAVLIKDLNALYENWGGFDAFYAKLRALGIPTTRVVMWIPIQEWNLIQFIKIPFLLIWEACQYIWNTDFVTTAREIYLSVLNEVAEEFMVRIGYPIVQKLPRMVRVILGFELPKGGELAEPTKIMQWQKRAQEKLEAREVSLPWWMEFPVRAWLVGAPLFLVTSWIAKFIFSLVGPRALPLNKYDITIWQAEQTLKEMTPRLKQLTRDPIKRVFDQMKRIRNPEVKLKDFVGIETFREEVDEVVSFLRDPGAFRKLGARPPRGVLIVGESGTGKTTLARAIASEARVPVVEVQRFDIQGGGDWVGQKASNVRELFKTARQFAPIILFMDDFHDFVGKRGETANQDTQELESLINQFLVELDGFETQEGVVVLATTGYPGRIDEALRRPGRMDRTITLLPPNRAQREQMLRIAAQEKMFPYVKNWVNWAEVAEKTEGLTYLDLQPIPIQLQCTALNWKITDEEELFTILFWLDRYNKVVPAWIRNTPLLRKWDQRLIDWLGIRVQKQDMEMAVRYMDVRGASKPGIELHDPGYKWTRETKYPHAVWAAGRGLLALLLPNFDCVELLWLDQTSWEGIAFTRLTRRIEEGYLETQTDTRSYFEKKLVLCYASHVACELLIPFGEKNDLAHPQIEEAIQTATRMVLEFGWALDDSPVVYMTKSSNGPMDMGYQQEKVLAHKVFKLLEAAFARAVQMLKRNKHVLEAFVEHLIEHEHVTQEDMQRILTEKGATFEEEPFTLYTEVVDASTNGTGRVSGLATATA